MLKAEIIGVQDCDVENYILTHLPRTPKTDVFEIEPCFESLNAFYKLLESKEIASYEGVIANEERYNYIRGNKIAKLLNLTHINKTHSIREWVKYYLKKENRFDIVVINHSIVQGRELEEYVQIIQDKKIEFLTYFEDQSNLDRNLVNSVSYANLLLGS